MGLQTLEAYIILTIRVFLGSYCLVSGLNFFLRFFPQPMGVGVNAEFIEVIMRMHLFEFVKVVELVAGACLILNRFTPLMLIVLFPVTVQIVIYDFFTPNLFGLWTGGRNFVFHCVLFLAYFRYYTPLFDVHPRRTPAKALGSVWRNRLNWRSDDAAP
ncbi:MAG: hypothetical protein JNJ73_16605 [Hyphomonadaceae bacterium]|nr:hypothetical protein [Hyphomonadaceae bacterium]